MALHIYGSPSSRTKRTMWMAAELGLAYQHSPFEWDDPFLKSAEFLALNPAGAIPTVVDGEVVVSESLAINLYLAKRYGRGAPLRLYPETLTEEAQVWRWTLWVQGQLEPWVQRDPATLALRSASGEVWAAEINTGLATLDRALAIGGWLIGDRFSVADLNVACVLSPSRVADLDLCAFPAIADWLARCYSRPAAQSVRNTG